ncbi:MAG: hypothetical protein DHS20C17_25800 [Cyclobacteriaceae bacterium]|nr:MAG: hypothetical protein DHS20C17_25800 [Cyclobacteriaceae bacterium]
MDSRGVFCVVGLLLGILLPKETLAQNSLIVRGMVLDAETLEPLPYAHIIRNNQSATTPDLTGRFVVRMSHLDTMSISHVSYITHNQVIRKAQNSDTVTLAIFLEREIRMLPDLKITPFPATLADFKQKILEAEVNDPLISFRKQQPAITYDIIMSPNYRGINQQTDLTLFSTGPGKGIGWVLRKLGVGKRKKK